MAITELALELPGGYKISPSPNFKTGDFDSLGSIVSQFLNLIFMLSGILLLVVLIWGAVSYILAGGDKEKLAQARSRLIYAIVGFIVIVIAFSVSQFMKGVFNPQNPQF